MNFAFALPLLLVACSKPLAPEVSAPSRLASDSVRSGPAKNRVVTGDEADLVLFYGGEQEGELGPCGCPVNPRGSVARVDGYLRAVEKGDPDTPWMLLNTGAWLSNTIGDTVELRADAKVANVHMTEALDIGGWDVLNVGFRDMPWFREAPIPDNAVSANIRPTRDGAGPLPFAVVPVGEYRVAVTGVSREGMTFLQPDTHAFADPVESLQELIPEMQKQADLVVVLSYDVGKAATDLTRLDVDVLIEAGEYKEQHEPVIENGTLWVRSRWRTERLGELRLFLQDGKISAAVDRMIDMDEEVPSTPTLRKLERRAKSEIEKALRQEFGS